MEIKRKPMPGQFYRHLERPSADKRKSLAWLCSSDMKGGTGSLIIAGQDPALSTLYYYRKIMEQPNDSKCRMRYKTEEHIKHIVAGCTTFAPPVHINRHNNLAARIPWTICKHVGYRLLTGTKNTYLKVSYMSTVPQLCGTY
jgi:hypothetical protein